MSDEATEPAPVEPVEETWAYAGRRLMSDKTIGYAWVFDAGLGEEHLFNKNTKSTVGYLYTRRVARDGDTISVYGEPVMVSRWREGERVEDPRPEWEAMDLRVHQFLSQRRIENAAAKAQTDLDRLIEPLLQVAQKLRNGAERDALTAYVLRRMAEVHYMRGRALS